MNKLIRWSIILIATLSMSCSENETLEEVAMSESFRLTFSELRTFKKLALKGDQEAERRVYDYDLFLQDPAEAAQWEERIKNSTK